MMHSTNQMLRKARCLAKKILKMKKEGDIDCLKHEIDILAQDAQMVEYETREFENDKEKETNT